jgi:hypothetical protein
MPELPESCPACQNLLHVSELTCPNCSTKVSGDFPLPELMQLSREEQGFMLDFIKTGGSLKKMAKKMGKSYPTVRNLLDDIIEKLKDQDK